MFSDDSKDIPDYFIKKSINQNWNFLFDLMAWQIFVNCFCIILIPLYWNLQAKYILVKSISNIVPYTPFQNIVLGTIESIIFNVYCHKNLMFK